MATIRTILQTDDPCGRPGSDSLRPGIPPAVPRDVGGAVGLREPCGPHRVLPCVRQASPQRRPTPSVPAGGTGFRHPCGPSSATAQTAWVRAVASNAAASDSGVGAAADSKPNSHRLPTPAEPPTQRCRPPKSGCPGNSLGNSLGSGGEGVREGLLPELRVRVDAGESRSQNLALVRPRWRSLARIEPNICRRDTRVSHLARPTLGSEGCRDRRRGQSACMRSRA